MEGQESVSHLSTLSIVWHEARGGLLICLITESDCNNGLLSSKQIFHLYAIFWLLINLVLLGRSVQSQKLGDFHLTIRIKLYIASWITMDNNIMVANYFCIIWAQEIFGPHNYFVLMLQGRWICEINKETILPGFKLCACGWTTVVQTNQLPMRNYWHWFRCDDSKMLL